jgi:hypothetical protein
MTNNATTFRVDDATKQVAVWLIARGLLSPSEAATMIGCTKQAVSLWCRDIALDEAREAQVKRVWKRAIAARK